MYKPVKSAMHAFWDHEMSQIAVYISQPFVPTDMASAAVHILRRL